MTDLIILDIDGTLFNSEEFGKQIRAHFTKILRIAEEELIRANADYYAELETTTDFNPHDITEFLSQRFGGSKTDLDSVFWEDSQIYKNSLYEEVEEVLKKLSEEKELGIYSQGFEELQKRKLDASGIGKYFSGEYMFFNRRKLSDESIMLLPRESTVVDDSHDVVLAISHYVDTIWMNRRTKDSDPNIKTIHSLRELV